FQVVSTTALTGAFSVAAFCGATLLGRREQWFGAVTIGLAVITLALSLWFLWGDPYRDSFGASFTDALDQVLYSLIVVTAVASVSLSRAHRSVGCRAPLGVAVVPLSSLLLKKEATPAVATPEGAGPTASPTQSTASPGLSAASLHRLETAARAEGITANELLDRLLETDGRPPTEPQT